MRGKILVQGVLLFTLLFSSTGCRNDLPNNGENIGKKDMEALVTVWASEEETDIFKNAAQRFGEKQPGVSVEIKTIKKNDVYNRMNTDFGSMLEKPDILTIDRDLVRTYVSRFPHEFMDLTAELGSIKDKFIKARLAEMTIDNKIRAIPWNVSPTVIFYRRDIFDESGINTEDIKTWNEYMEVGKTLSEKSGGKLKLLAVNESGNEAFFQLLLNQLYSGYYTREGRNNVNSLDTVRVMSLIKDFHKEGLIHNVSDQQAVIDAALNGSVALIPAEVSFAPVLMEKCKEMKGKWGIMSLPAFEPGGNKAASVGGSAIMVAEKSRENKAVLDFIKFLLTDRDSVKYSIIEKFIFPAVTEFYDETWLNEKNEFFRDQKVWRNIAQLAKEDHEIKYTDNFMEVKKLVLEAQNKILFGNMEITSVLKETAQKIDELKPAGYSNNKEK